MKAHDALRAETPAPAQQPRRVTDLGVESIVMGMPHRGEGRGRGRRRAAAGAARRQSRGSAPPPRAQGCPQATPVTPTHPSPQQKAASTCSPTWCASPWPRSSASSAARPRRARATSTWAAVGGAGPGGRGGGREGLVSGGDLLRCLLAISHSPGADPHPFAAAFLRPAPLLVTAGDVKVCVADGQGWGPVFAGCARAGVGCQQGFARGRGQRVGSGPVVGRCCSRRGAGRPGYLM
jgi:hypothetical protein